MPKHPGMGEMTDCACGCGGKIWPFDAQKRPRRFMKGHAMIAAYGIYRKQPMDQTTPDAIEITTMR